MTKFDLFDSIGNVDDKLIDKAMEPKEASKKVFLAITSVAACAVVACAAVLIVQNMIKSSNVIVDSGASSKVGTSSVKPVNEESPENGLAGGASSEDPVPEDSDEKTLEQMPFKIYYIANGKTEQKTIVTNASPKNLFDIWKAENKIGDEVRFISAKLSDNGITDICEYSGIEVATHKVGDHTVYTLTITKNLEQYYGSIGKELLLDSLKKTMIGMCDPKPDEYQLILSDNTENEKTESKSSVSDNKQSNDDVVNSVAYSDPETRPTNPEAKESFEQEATSGVSQEYTPHESETDQASSNYAEESESNRIDPNDIQYNDQGEILE